MAEPARIAGRIERGVTAVARLVGLGQVVVAIVWAAANFALVPVYGDTPEYVSLAATLRVDGYRTVGYPILVRGALDLSHWAHIPYQVPLYALQILSAAIATWYLVRSIAPRMSRSRVASVTALVVTSPLVLHYAMSVLSDSIAGSLFIVALAGGARIIVRAEVRPATVVWTAVGAFGAGIMRTEKPAVIVVSVLVALGTVLGVNWTIRRHHRVTPFRLVTLLSLAALVLPAAGAGLINHATQTGDYGRPAPGLVTMAMSRVVWPHLREIRSELPEAVQAEITEQDATTFDAHNNNAMPMVVRMRAMDGGGNSITHAAIRAAIVRFWPQVLADTVTTAAEYSATPLVFAGQGAVALTQTNPGDTPTWWDITRMNMAHPELTDAWLLVSFFLLGLLLGRMVLLLLLRRYRAGENGLTPQDRRVALMVWGGTAVNGCLFAVAQGAAINARYGLSNVVMISAALAISIAGGARAPSGRHLTRDSADVHE